MPTFLEVWSSLDSKFFRATNNLKVLVFEPLSASPVGAPSECATFAPLTLKLLSWKMSHSAFYFSMAAFNSWTWYNNFDNASFTTF
jgi:hypothetical protein